MTPGWLPRAVGSVLPFWPSSRPRKDGDPVSVTLPADPETIFTYGAPQLKFGFGASAEIGYDLSQYGVRRVLVVTDAGVAATGSAQRVADQMGQFAIEARVFDGVHVEPTDVSLTVAVEHARASGPWDAYVAVGGGSSIDTAKAINLLTTNPGDLMDYLNVPIGKGRAPANPLHPLVAVPTTTGTGSRAPRSASWTCWRSRSRPASAMPGCARRWRSSTPT